MQTVYFVLVALGIFVVGAFWGKGIMWRLLLTVGYIFWRCFGGMRRLLDRHDAPGLRQLLGAEEYCAWAEEDDVTFWAYIPPVMPREGELGDGEVFVGDTLQIADFNKHEEFCKKLDVARNDASVMLAKITFFHIFAYTGDCAEVVCHRRTSLPFIAWCTRVAGIPGCPVCGASFMQVQLRAPEYVECRARLRVAEVIVGIERGEIPEFKCFALQHPNVEESAACIGSGRTAQLHVFFGDESALQLWSDKVKKQLRPLTLEVVVAKGL